MKSMLRSLLSYANVMSTIAVFLALGGGSLAAVSIRNGPEAQSAQQQGGDTGEDGGGGIGGDGNGDGAGGDGGEQNGDGDNPDGDSGDGDSGDGGNGAGEGGEDATDGGEPRTSALGFTTREGDAVTTDSDSTEVVASASCEGNEQVIGGGVRTEPQGKHAEPVVVSSAPDGDSWSATVYNGSGMDRVRVTAYALCASQSP